MGILVFTVQDIKQYLSESWTEIAFTRPYIDTTSGYDAYLEKTNVEPAFYVSPISIHGVVSLITAFSHLYAVYLYRSTGVCTKRPNLLRCGEYSITASMMTVSGYVSLGFTDFYALLLVFMSSVSVQFCGLFMEAYKDLEVPYPILSKIYKGEKKEMIWKYFFLIGCLIQTGIVLPITIWTLSARPSNRAGVVAAWLAYVGYYTLFPLNAYSDSKQKDGIVAVKPAKGWFNDRTKMVSLYSVTDQRYVLLSFCSKITLLWITVCAIIYNITKSDDWYNGLLVSAFAPLALTIFFLALSIHQKKQLEEAIQKKDTVKLRPWESVFFWIYVDSVTEPVSAGTLVQSTINNLHF